MRYVPFTSCVFVSVAFVLPACSRAFQISSRCHHHYQKISNKNEIHAIQARSPSLQVLFQSKQKTDGGNQEVDLESLKQELMAYLVKRKEADGDTAAKAQVGRVVGGTKGNPVLEFVSGSPNKAFVIDEAPNMFDYDELEKYGYGKLATVIMKAGGRNAMYDMLGLERPPPPKRLKPKSAPKLVIDKTGETDKARYSGLKMGQILDDDAMAQALAEAQRKSKEGAPMRSKIAEEEYVQPFAGTVQESVMHPCVDGSASMLGTYPYLLLCISVFSLFQISATFHPR